MDDATADTQTVRGAQASQAGARADSRLAGLRSHNAALTAELAGSLQQQQDSEARLRFATEAARLGVWELDLLSFELTASPICKENFGRAASQPFTYDDFLRAVDPEDLSRVGTDFERSITTGSDVELECRVARPDGSLAWVQVRAQVMRGADGAPFRMAGVTLDVTQRRAGELRLELSEQVLRLATDAAEIGTWDVDVLTGALNWSDRTRAMFGISPGAPCTMQDFYDGLHPDDLQATSAAFASALDPSVRATYDVEYRTVGKEDGAVRWVAAKGRGLFADGRCHRAIGTAIDVTARKLAETRQAVRVELGGALRRTADGPTLLAIAVERLGRHLGASCVGYSEIDDATSRAAIQQQWVAPGVAPLVGQRRLDVYGERLTQALRAGTPAVVRDVALDPLAAGFRSAFDAIRARAFIYAPLLKHGRLAGILFVLNPQPRAWTPDDVALVEEVAERTWMSLRQIQAETALLESEARFQAIVDSVDQMIWSARADGRHDYYNRRWYEFTGLPDQEMIGKPWSGLVHPDDYESVRSAWEARLADGELYRVEYRLRHRSGEYRWVLARAQAVKDAAGRIERWFGTCTVIQEIVEARDVMARSREQLEALVEERTGELMQAEAALRQAQKMEAVGHLTGGIAHDFNNLLAGIMGSLELVQRRVDSGRTEGLERFTSAAIESARRASGLTQRLLAFARRQPLDPKRVDANRLVSGMDDLLRRTLGPPVELEMRLEPGLWPTLCDPNQLESAILNLAINARDAMPEGGRLTISTRNAELDAAQARAEGGRDLRPGQYVALCVTDTGAGMTPDVIARAFDPFFTTKPIGKGTGLGLSMLYGFVRQSEGCVKVESEVGRGTKFRLYLPRHRGGAEEDHGQAAGAAASAEAERGEAVLVVDDEPTVRMLVVETLEELGYAAIEASDGPSGLAVLQSGARVDLLVTDVGLPGLNGRQLADAARVARPGLRVLFMTGYAHNAAVGQGEALEPGMEILSKPFRLDALAAKIREMIER